MNSTILKFYTLKSNQYASDEFQKVRNNVTLPDNTFFAVQAIFWFIFCPFSIKLD